MNTVTVEGTVTDDVWTYAGDTLFRLRHNDGDAYFTVRFRNLPLNIEPGTRVVVKGKLTSREQRIFLNDFVKRADRGEVDDDAQALVDQLDEYLGYALRSYTEVQASEIRALR